MYNHGITAVKTAPLPGLATRNNGDCEKASPPKSYYTSFSRVGRGKYSKCINKDNVKIYFLYFI